MYKIACRDIGGMDCDFETTGATIDEVVKKTMDHAKKEHADIAKTMTKDQMEGMIRKAVKEM